MSHRVLDHIRQHALRSAGVPDDPPADGYPQTSPWWVEFAGRQAERLLTGRYRYSEPGTPGRPTYDYARRIRAEILRWEQSGHPEALVEIATHALMAYADGGHHERGWRGTCSEEERIGTEEARSDACQLCGRVLRETGRHAPWCRLYLGMNPLLNARMDELARERVHALHVARHVYGLKA